jgi:hypothetical protein
MKTIHMTARILRPLLERHQSAWHILNCFGQTPKTEADFRARFEELAPEDKEFLLVFYGMDDAWSVFRRICVFWNVPIADGQPENLE